MRRPKAEADFALVTDTELFAPDLLHFASGCAAWFIPSWKRRARRPICTPGVRRSGANAIFGLVEILSKLKDADGKVLIPASTTMCRSRLPTS